MSGTMRMSSIGEGPILTLPDGTEIDLSKRIRLTKTPESSYGTGVVIEGVLNNNTMTATSTYGGPMVVHLSFHGGVTADWCPMLGDTLEQVAE